MITLPTLIQEVIAQVQGGIYTDETKFDSNLIESCINQARSQLITASNLHRVPDMLYQTHVVDYEPLWQDVENCFVEFKVPDVMAIGQSRDGFGYVGSPNGFNAFPRYGSGTMGAVLATHRVTKMSNRPDGESLWDFLYDTQYGFSKVRIYNNIDIRDFIVRGVFSVPTEVNGYRKEFDAYPIDSGMIKPLKEIANALLVQMAATPIDSISNTMDAPSQGGTPIKDRVGKVRI